LKKDRQKLEDILNVVVKDYANDNAVISEVVRKFTEKGFPIGKISGLFTQATPFSYISDLELCLFTMYLHHSINNYKIDPNHFFNEAEIQQAEALNYFSFKEKTNRIVLYNVDQINEHQWICSKETYQNIVRHFENGLLTYNPKTQREPLKRKVRDRIIEVINIDMKKISEIKEEMLNNTFNTNAIIFNVRRMTGMEKIKYDAKNRTLTIEVDNDTKVDVIDGFHRLGGMLKAVEQKPEMDRLTSVYIYHVDEEKARQIIRQESKATPISEEWIEIMDVSNPNMEVTKTINNRQRMNEMFNRVGLDSFELRRENKLVTFETLSKTIEYVFNLKDKPIIEARKIENFLIELFNIVIGVNYTAFNANLAETRKVSYLADNNTFIGYIALGEELSTKYPDQWQDKLLEALNEIDFSKNNESLRAAGLENNINLSTIKKVYGYFRKLAK